MSGPFGISSFQSVQAVVGHDFWLAHLRGRAVIGNKIPGTGNSGITEIPGNTLPAKALKTTFKAKTVKTTVLARNLN